MSKTVLICSNAYPPSFIGGAELIAHYQAKALQRLGHRVVVFTGDISDVGDRHQLRYEPFEDLPVYRTRLTGLDYQPDMVNFHHAAVERQFASILQQQRPDVVHAHNLIGLSTGILSQAREFGARTVLTLHDHWGFCYKNTLIRQDHRICEDFTGCHECKASIPDGADRNVPIRLRNDYIGAQLDACDFLVSPSLYLARQYVRAGFPLSRMRVVWNGIDLERFSAIRKSPRAGEVRFTFIGYLGAHKGVQTLMQAIELLAARTRNFVVNIVGVGELQQELRERFGSGELAGRVRLLGRVPNAEIAGVFADTDVQLLPSVWPENQPVSITEAMASRTAVIASTLGGTPELVDDGSSGLLVAPGNAPALAGAMMKFIESPDLIEQFGTAGYEKIRSCSFESQVRKLVRLYDAPGQAPRPVQLVRLNEQRFTPEQVRELNEGTPRLADHRPVRLVLSEWAAHPPQTSAPVSGDHVPSTADLQLMAMATSRIP
ncbi:MAG TPA: glycosyltransferase family 4 protein [Bryobacteraceae bacterium]|nr:glycosyltransferase family 4 protein [Bryobacteraceae bacterium]